MRVAVTPRWSRRAALVLGLAATGVVIGVRPAMADAVTVGSLLVEIPTSLMAVPPDDTLGQQWQWVGRDRGPTTRPAALVLARADLPATDAEELLGLVLAGSAGGLLPDLVLSNRRLRSMPGGGDQVRHDLEYAAGGGGAYHGVLLIATREQPPSALLVVVGDGSLTAGTIDEVLDSARWRS